MHKFVVGLAVGTLLTVTIAAAGQQARWILGAGVESCGTWTMAHAPGQDQTAIGGAKQIQLQAWLLGFVTGANYTVPVNQPPDGNGLVAWVGNYCAAHPLESIADAAAELARIVRGGK